MKLHIKKSLRLVTLTATLTCLSNQPEALAGLITVTFNATVSGIDDEAGFWAGAGVVPGDQITGSFKYDTSAPVSAFTHPSVDRGYFPGYDQQLSIGGKVEWVGINGSGSLRIDDDFVPYGNSDFFDFGQLFGGHFRNTTSGETIYNSSGSMWVRDTTGASLTTYVVAPDLATLQHMISPTSNLGYETFFRSNMAPNFDFFATGLTLSAQEETSTASVPDSGSITPALAGVLAGLGALRRRWA